MALRERLAPIWTLGWLSARELLRERVLYNVVLLGLGLLGITHLAGGLTYVVPERIALNLSVWSVSLVSLLLANLGGVTLMSRELERKTYLLAMSYPIERWQFVAGKWLGLALVLALQQALLAGLGAAIVALFGGSVWMGSWVAFQLILWIMSLCVGSFALAAAAWTQPGLALGISIGWMGVGLVMPALERLALAAQTPDTWLSPVLGVLSWVLPNLGRMVYADHVTYDLPIPGLQVFAWVLYGLGWSAVGIFSGSLALERRDS